MMINKRKERDYYEKDYDGIRNCFNSFNIGCNNVVVIMIIVTIIHL